MGKQPEYKDPLDESKQFSWLRRQVERRNPENAFIRRWFKLADRVLEENEDRITRKTENAKKPKPSQLPHNRI